MTYVDLFKLGSEIKDNLKASIIIDLSCLHD